MRDWRRTVPTVLTLLRLAALPAVVLLWLRESLILALILYVALALTDLADGWMARRLRAVTKAGTWLDPIVDIVVLLTLLAVLSLGGRLPLWAPIAPSLAAVAFLLTSRRKPRYGLVGKHYGAILYVAVGISMLGLPASGQMGIAATVTALGIVAMAARLSAGPKTRAEPPVEGGD